MRRLLVEVEGGTGEQQADCLRRLAWTVDNTAGELLPASGEAVTTEGVGFMKSVRCTVTLVEMADYDRAKLAAAWFDSPFGSVNALARATGIELNRMYAILTGDKRATVKELNAICEELNISVESVKAE